MEANTIATNESQRDSVIDSGATIHAAGNHPSPTVLQRFDGGESTIEGIELNSDESNRCIDRHNDNFITGFNLGFSIGALLTLAVVVIVYFVMPVKSCEKG